MKGKEGIKLSNHAVRRLPYSYVVLLIWWIFRLIDWNSGGLALDNFEIYHVTSCNQVCLTAFQKLTTVTPLAVNHTFNAWLILWSLVTVATLQVDECTFFKRSTIGLIQFFGFLLLLSNFFSLSVFKICKLFFLTASCEESYVITNISIIARRLRVNYVGAFTKSFIFSWSIHCSKK